MTIPTSDTVTLRGLINAARLWESANQLATMTLPNMPWTRRAFTPLFEQGRRWLKQQMEERSAPVGRARQRCCLYRL
ncbi:hypothetical protein [Chania multitudinisentens]|uniref:hypothetical protein n=1 Tax=Chania multitudinisentens TaxID=1639108 RepID=UPI0004B55158|nr:hypothetical protein [Chania multitudinisentens]